MTIIDSQVHVYEANTPKRPWHSVPNWPDHVTGDEMVAAMDKVGVDGAIFISAFSMYQYDASYAVEVQRAHPGRFAIVKPVNPDDPAVADVIADWKKIPGAVGIRIMLTKEANRAPDDPGLDRIARAAARHDFPVNVLFWGNLDAGTALIDRHPDTRFIIDHLGILQPRVPPAPPQPWADLPKVLELAKRPNAVIKVSGACTLSRGAVSFPGHLGPAGPRVRCLGFRSLLVGHGLDARVRRRQLRAGRRALPEDRPPERHRAGDADGRRLRQGLWLVAEERLERNRYPSHPLGRVNPAVHVLQPIRTWPERTWVAGSGPATGYCCECRSDLVLRCGSIEVREAAYGSGLQYMSWYGWLGRVAQSRCRKVVDTASRPVSAQ